MLSVSLCHSAFDFANIPVRMHGVSNRTESKLTTILNVTTPTYTFRELRVAMGRECELSPEERGILT